MDKIKEIVDSAPDLGEFDDYGATRPTYLKMKDLDIKYAKVYLIVDTKNRRSGNTWSMWKSHIHMFSLITSIKNLENHPIYMKDSSCNEVIDMHRKSYLTQLSPAKELFPWKDDLPNEISFNPPLIVDNTNNNINICTPDNIKITDFTFKITGIIYFDWSHKYIKPLEYIALGLDYINFYKEDPDYSDKKIEDFTFSKYCKSRIIYFAHGNFYLTENNNRFILKRPLLEDS